jgi:hypothetical protein
MVHIETGFVNKRPNNDFLTVAESNIEDMAGWRRAQRFQAWKKSHRMSRDSGWLTARTSLDTIVALVALGTSRWDLHHFGGQAAIPVG